MHWWHEKCPENDEQGRPAEWLQFVPQTANEYSSWRCRLCDKTANEEHIKGSKHQKNKKHYMSSAAPREQQPWNWEQPPQQPWQGEQLPAAAAAAAGPPPERRSVHSPPPQQVVVMKSPPVKEPHGLPPPEIQRGPPAKEIQRGPPAMIHPRIAIENLKAQLQALKELQRDMQLNMVSLEAFIRDAESGGAESGVAGR